MMFRKIAILCCKNHTKQKYTPGGGGAECRVLLYLRKLYIYNEPSIISGTGAAIWSKTNFEPTSTIALEVVPFRSYATFPALLPFSDASWKSCSVRVFSTACDSYSIITVVPERRETEKSRGAESGE
jgi:hypothetical protein